MKKFLQYLLLVILFSFWGIMLTNREQTREVVQEVKVVAQKKLGIDRPCSRPLEYAIGNVDPKFSISQEELEQLASQAAKVWNEAEGKTLVEYDPNSDFKINLVYDNRQEQSAAVVEMEKNLQNLEEANSALSKKYNSLSAAYKDRIDDYNKDIAEYKSNLEKYNKDVEYWNSQGGAPEDVYNKLKRTKSDLDDEYEKINQEGAAIDSLAKETNSVAKKENQIVADYNSTVSTYKDQYGDMQEFEKGIFDGREIDIYQFKTTTDLRLTLIHELGHYIGMGHVDNSSSIMYYLIGDQNMNKPTLTMEDRTALGGICKAE
ncbi:MAG: matrixin family metalloprotease [Parcubacteria group bacterium]